MHTTSRLLAYTQASLQMAEWYQAAPRGLYNLTTIQPAQAPSPLLSKTYNAPRWQTPFVGL